MLRIVHRNCAGMDVHKKFIAVCIATTDFSGVTTYKKKQFSTFNSDLKACRDWLLKYGCSEVCMESTGKYWIPIFNVLEGHLHVVVANPKYVRAIKGQKTDDKDAMWIADLFKFYIIPSSYIPIKEIRKLRELFRYRYNLVNARSSEKMRLQNSLTVSNIALGTFSPGRTLNLNTANAFSLKELKTRQTMLFPPLLDARYQMTRH